MEYKIYPSKQEFLQDADFYNAAIGQFAAHGLNVQKYNVFNTQNYVVKFIDGENSLLVVRISSPNTLLWGNADLASFAANVLADFHLEVGALVGAENLLEAFSSVYYARLGDTVKQALFAGGCFWCMAKPYYEYDGILSVFSGYAGGSEINPTYEEVKKGRTHHRETVMLEYDSAVITFRELLDIYFDTIDPFDDGGQFIDRGENYTCAIFTSDPKETEIVINYIHNIEKQFCRKVCVPILPDQVFYKAEEYHQDFALKNPAAMEEELKTSGRLQKSASKGGTAKF